MLTNIFGWVGVALILIAYYLLSKEKLTNKDVRYHAMNLIGAIGVGVNVYAQEAWPIFVMEIIWCLVAAAAIIRIERSRRTS